MFWKELMKRYETKYKKLSQEEKQKIVKAHNLILAHFNGYDRKRVLWFAYPNPQLGGMTPDQMIQCGRIDKLLSMIETALDENKRTPDRAPGVKTSTNEISL